MLWFSCVGGAGSRVNVVGPGRDGKGGGDWAIPPSEGLSCGNGFRCEVAASRGRGGKGGGGKGGGDEKGRGAEEEEKEGPEMGWKPRSAMLPRLRSIC